jgi:hypothetical protein
MASKKTGNLAALAALAGLAYMATRGKGEDKTKDVVKSKSMDVKPVDVKPVDVKPVDLGEIRDEEGTLSTLRRNTETGELYDPTESSSGKSAAAKVATQPKAPSAPVTKIPEGAFRGIRSDSKAAKEAEQAKLMSPYKPMRPDVKLRDTEFTYPTGDTGAYSNKQLKKQGAEERPESDEQKFFGKKRGGVIKKMASGGMASPASKRADGIATKGKTRGKIC